VHRLAKAIMETYIKENTLMLRVVSVLDLDVCMSDRAPHTPLAIKQIILDDKEYFKYIKREIRILRLVAE
jgi:hypothetical protein